ncbi:MAG: CBS domain-containing protein [Alphaproteobacteria bacterium]|nr:CBS domain-containing protein [Alphaproteobacteria bacterium]
MLVRDAMTAPVLSVASTATIGEAIAAMLARRVSGLPVVDDRGAPIGMVTEGDLLRRNELGTERTRSRWLQFFAGPGQSADEYVRSHGRKVAEVMTEHVVSLPPDAPLVAAIDLMLKKHIKRVLVMQGANLLGILARSDVLRALSGTLPGPAPRDVQDDTIRKAVSAELEKQPWSGKDMIRVEVDQGKVTLSGMILDERARLAAKVAAENTPGVTSVVDDLIWVEPLSGTVILGDGGVIAPPVRIA